MNLRIAIPLFHVTSTPLALKHYCGGLGFTVESQNLPDSGGVDPAYSCINRDGVRLHLSAHAGDGGARSMANIVVNDVDSLYREFTSRAVDIHLGPIDQTWGVREMYVRDPDGNTLRFQEWLE